MSFNILREIGEQTEVSTAMSKFCCITNLIRFMINEAEKLTKGSVYEDTFFIVHDTLVLMIAKEKINWMRQKVYLHRWLIPLNGLQDDTPYAGRPVGNSPKFMPLDNLINCNILKSLRFRSALSCCILDGEVTNEEERIVRFSSSTPR